MRLNGSRRWIALGPVTFQPSELAKLAAIVFLAAWFARREDSGSNVLFGLILPLAIIGVPAALVLGEVDLGTTALLGTTAFVVMFVAGTNPLWLGMISFAGLGGLLIVASRISERMGRLSAFLHPQNYKEDAGLQQMQALIAWGSGGMEGLGLGNGRQKMLYLPYAHTDFIFPIIGEELGAVWKRKPSPIARKLNFPGRKTPARRAIPVRTTAARKQIVETIRRSRSTKAYSRVACAHGKAACITSA
jgi:cell division protein FtsW